MVATSKSHLYEQIADEIRTAIGRGSYLDGKLPSERRLVRTFGSQRKTVRRALELLEREGRVTSVSKSGWFVRERDDGATERRRIVLATFRRGELPSTDAILRGLSGAVGAQGHAVLRYDSTGGREADHLRAVEELAALETGGVVMWPHSPLDAEPLARLQAHAPIVLLDRRVFGLRADSVHFDDQAGGRMATEHLLAQGHRRIAFLGDEPFVESVQARWTGYRRALEDAGVEPDERLSILTFGPHEPVFTVNLRLLVRETPEPPTAVVCSNDGVASRLLLFLRKEGLRVPDDVAVTGFGNGAPDYLDLMGLTSVAQSFEEMGRQAGVLLTSRLANPLRHREPREVLLPMTLVPRASSGASG